MDGLFLGARSATVHHSVGCQISEGSITLGIALFRDVVSAGVPDLIFRHIISPLGPELVSLDWRTELRVPIRGVHSSLGADIHNEVTFAIM